MRKIRVIQEMIFKLENILTKKQKKSAIKLLAIIILGAFFELMGVSIIMPFMEILVAPDKVIFNPILQPFIAIFHINSTNGVLVLICCGIIVLYLVKNIFLIFSYYLQFDYSTNVKKELSIKLLNSYMMRPYTFFLNANSGEIIRVCNNDVDGVYDILSYIFTILAESLTTLAIGIYLIWLAPVMAISAIMLILVVMLVIVFILKPIVNVLGQKYMNAQAAKNKAIYQTIEGVKELFVMQRKELFVETYEEAAENVRIAQRNHEFLNSTPERIIEGVCVGGIISIIMTLLVLNGNNSSFIPELGVFAMAAFKIMPSVGKLSSRITKIVYCLPMLNNVYNNLVQVENYQREREKYEQKCGIIEPVKEFKENLSIKNVYWTYEGQKQSVLKGINLEVKKGESIALIGSSGAGKTTLVDVILGLLKPEKGQVLLDGQDVYGMPRDWANIVGYVPQSVFLIDDTVRNNISFGLKDVNDIEIWNALEQAQLKEFVQKLPNGLNTIVGERGVKFSGGQRQRIAIARALYSNPQILVLDEATASLDNDTENAVMEAIDHLQGRMTMVIVAHRLTTIKNCDRIYEISNGCAIERKKEEILRNV